tara:strand:- start:2817 stop:4157 length:1341 start_codon:yes stop_codon:yes gene_type:complete
MNKKIQSEYLLAKSCGRLIGLDVKKVTGITDKGNIFKIPHLKKPILGLGKYLNKVLAVVDTGSFSGLRRSQKHIITKWIITETLNGFAALAVDEVYGIKNVLLKEKLSKKKNISNNFEFEGKVGDILLTDTILPKINKTFEKNNFTKINPEANNIKSDYETKTFLCFKKNSHSSAIEMSNIVSIHSMNECEEPLVKIKNNIVLGNLNNQLIPIFYDKTSENLIIIKKDDKIFGVSCEEVTGIKKVNESNIFFEETQSGQKKQVGFYNKSLKDTQIISTDNLLKINPIDNWMPDNLVTNNTMEKSYDNNFLFFKILNFNFGLPIEKIKRVDFFRKPKSIPNVKKGILGVSDLDQKTVVVIDFLELLNIKQIEENTSSHKEIIFIDTGEANIGLAVNEILGIKTINQDQLKESSNFDGMKTKILPTEKQKTFFPLMDEFQQRLSEYLI